jgi:hydroxymethylbilane synthase
VTPHPIRVGTRGSALALAQARLVVEALARAGVPAEPAVIVTAGDRRAPDSAWGEGAFVSALEDALREGRIDVGVHSAKDLPTAEDARLGIAAYLPREDPRDALVGREAVGWRSLPDGARVGTDSPRRAGFILAQRSDLRVHPLHGNVDTRLARLDSGETDALVLAVAGLVRLGRAGRIGERLAPTLVPPAPGQGAIAVQVRRDDDGIAQLVARLDDPPTRAAVEAERAFLRAAGGGCRAPIGALARVVDGRLVLLGGFARADGSASAIEQLEGPVAEAEDVAGSLARRLIERAGRRSPGIDAPSARSLGSDIRVLVLREPSRGQRLARGLQARGLDPVLVPAIATVPAGDGAMLRRSLAALGPRDWIVVTSVSAVSALEDGLGRREQRVETAGDRQAGPRWAVVGEATAAAVARLGVTVGYRPPEATAAALGRALPLRGGERVLLPRGDQAGPDLPRLLRGRGALVEEVVVYRTIEGPEGSEGALAAALADGLPALVLFTSGSTARGLRRMADRLGAAELDALRVLPAVALGPEAAAAARAEGFRVVDHADGSIEGLIELAARAAADESRADLGERLARR